MDGRHPDSQPIVTIQMEIATQIIESSSRTNLPPANEDGPGPGGG